MFYRILSGLLITGLLTGIGVAEPVEDLRDKIGQMIIIGFDGTRINKNALITKQLQQHNLGGVILFDFNPKTGLFDKNIENPAQVRQLTADLQHFNYYGQEQQHRPHIPLLISVDYEGGMVNRLNPDKGFPMAPSAAHVGQLSMSEASTAAAAMATTLQENGFNLNFAPILDVNVNPDSPIIGKKDRSFSADPYMVANYAGLYANAYLQHKVQCAYKHFPGHGSATGDTHLGFVDVTSTWQPLELIPYQQLIESEHTCDMIMTAHLINRQLDESGLPATLSHKIITELLRNTLQFHGVVVSDDMQMKAISEHYSLHEALTLAINAGVDMILFGNQLTETPQDPEEIIDLIEAQVQAGEISEARIDEAYERILKMKQAIANE